MKRQLLSFVFFESIFLMLFSCSNDKPTGSSVETPVITTNAVTYVTKYTAECGGVITSDGGGTITARGICWSTNQTPTVADNKTSDGAGTGSFASSLVDLNSNTVYFVRAYAANSKFIGYGNIRSFKTTDSTGTMTDIDGNIYQTVKIGDQWWMAENLKVTHYRNGQHIPVVTDSIAWGLLSSGAYCEYDNDTGNAVVYGRLYNGYAVEDIRGIAPVGWHVPADSEWKQLEMYLGMSQAESDGINWRGTDEGGKLKESGTDHWISPNAGASNESGFTALPGGSRVGTSSLYYSISEYALFWSSTSYEWSMSYAYSRHLGSAYSNIMRTWNSKIDGLSVRCVRD
jgi:uncharacterized protein (TIGR02145 family)